MKYREVLKKSFFSAEVVSNIVGVQILKLKTAFV